MNTIGMAFGGKQFQSPLLPLLTMAPNAVENKNVQLSPPPYLVPSECGILFIMYFVIAPNANKITIHTDQLMMSKSLMYVCSLLWRAGHNKLIANPHLPGK